MIFILYCSALAPSLQLLTSQKTRACLGTRSTPGHICMMPGGKDSASRGTMTTKLLSHLSRMAFSIHTKDQQGGAGFVASPVGRDLEQAERLRLPWYHLGFRSSTAQLQSDGEGRAPVSLSTCHYIPGRVWHFAVVESLVAEKLAWPPCQGYMQPNTPCLPPPDSLSLQVCSPSSKARIWLSFANVGLLTIPLSSLPPSFCSSQNSFQFVKIFSGNKEYLDSVQDPRVHRKKNPM